jgi:hypothetical protein
MLMYCYIVTEYHRKEIKIKLFNLNEFIFDKDNVKKDDF